MRLFLLVLCCPLLVHAFTANVMAPLQVEDRAAFRQQLAVAKQIGVDGVSVDVWWGLVEQTADQQFNWQYYDAIFADITAAGLKIVPIMAFHQCGGNVGDDCDIPLPPWIWQHFLTQGLSATDLQYKSEFGHYSAETLSLWADKWVLGQYLEFMQAFASHYSHLSGQISEINISMGPAGELRYPSYNSHDQGKTAYPSRGGFQAYSRLAIADFRHAMQQKYQQLNALNKAWLTGLSGFEQIQPPLDMYTFIASGAHVNSAYGRDFIHWYHQALLAHGKRMLDNALLAFAGINNNIELGFKIPGIHWKIAADDSSQRSAELAAGLISTASPFVIENGFGYHGIIDLAASYAAASRPVVLHFTALEMDNKPAAPDQSMAKNLVNWVGAEASRQRVALKGENALAGGISHNTGWDNIQAALSRGDYRGLTLLRIEQVTTGGVGQQRYQQLIQQFKRPPDRTD
uniref:family 14 glycosylhydrolase n=1 Tax=Rheinheimera sp. TaxID=1869214 RepID=UPI004048E32A